MLDIGPRAQLPACAGHSRAVTCCKATTQHGGDGDDENCADWKTICHGSNPHEPARRRPVRRKPTVMAMTRRAPTNRGGAGDGMSNQRQKVPIPKQCGAMQFH
jgi:hypothetical protein